MKQYATKTYDTSKEGGNFEWRGVILYPTSPRLNARLEYHNSIPRLNSAKFSQLIIRSFPLDFAWLFPIICPARSKAEILQ